jgi:cytochrome c oxidase subunit 2
VELIGRVASVEMTPARRIALAVSALAVIPACAPEAVGEQGEGVGSLYRIFMIVAAVIFVVVAGLIAWSIVRYRDRGGSEEPPQIHTNLGLEITWFAVPTVIVVVLFLLSMDRLNAVNEEDPDPGVTVAVEGFQWGWEFTYDNGVVIRSLPDDPAEVVLPVGEPVAFTLESPDVIHSFYIPRLLMKRDVIPGRTNRIDVVFDEIGTYDGKCAEFCGLLHDQMDLSISIVPADEFEDWVTEQAEGVEDTDGDG